jgi:glycosyltransferase involved in cell wall biosynthesis
MRFLIDARMWNYSGIGTYIRALVPRVVENFPSISFTLIIEKGAAIEGDISNKKNVDLIEFSSPIYSIKEQIEFIFKAYGRFDYLWSPHYNIPIFFDGQLFVTVHDVFHLAFPEYNKGLKKAYAKLLFTIIKFKAKKIFTVSDFTKQELIKYAGVNPEKIIPVPNGIEDEWIDLPVTEPLLDKPYILYVGNVKPHKNLMSLINAFKLIAGKIDHQLVIVGKKEGFITGDMEVLKASEELGERVLFTGFISDDILKRYYQHAEVLVFPSIYEGFGLPPLEAMAVNCPTIVSNKASIPEVCGDASLYVDPLNPEDISKKILLIISNNQVRNELILKGQNHVKKYSWQITASKIIGTFDEVLK